MLKQGNWIKDGSVYRYRLEALEDVNVEVVVIMMVSQGR